MEVREEVVGVRRHQVRRHATVLNVTSDSPDPVARLWRHNVTWVSIHMNVCIRRIA